MIEKTQPQATSLEPPLAGHAAERCLAATDRAGAALIVLSTLSAALYLAAPNDLIPDWVGIIGYVDDVDAAWLAAIVACSRVKEGWRARAISRFTGLRARIDA